MKPFVFGLFAILFMSSSCPQRLPGPEVKVYVSKPERGGLYRAQGQELIDYNESEGYRCLNKRDFDSLLNWCLQPENDVKSKKKRLNFIKNANLVIDQ